jgi:uroporphyrinogen III methyltransferase/synthase
VVVHDRLSDPTLLALAPPGAERVDVGKQPDDRGDQEAINRLLVERAQLGLCVVRLKGGDPFVFGRGGEEAMALKEAGIAFEVVPGVTSAIAAPAYAGVPVTHRGLATSFTVVAGHSRSVDAPPTAGGTNWEALARAGGTIVVLMGAAHGARVAERLMAGGMGPATPVLAVQWGTTGRQSSLRTTLSGLLTTPLAPPVTVVIGEVAGLDLSWAAPGVLSGQTVVVTRAAHQSVELAARLRQQGALVLEAPMITVAPPADGGRSLAAAAARLRAGGYSWVVFTSANAVDQFFAYLPDTRALAGTAVAAVGPGTAEALRRYRVVADLVPEDYQGEELAACFPAPPPAPADHAVLLPQAAGARPALRLALSRQGWDVEPVEAYRTVPHHVGEAMLGAIARADAICFASPSAIDAYLGQAGPGPHPPVVACIGPVTAATARGHGLGLVVEAGEHTVEGLVTALVAELTGGRQPGRARTLPLTPGGELSGPPG